VTRRKLTFSPEASRDLRAVLNVIADHAGARVAARWRGVFDERTKELIRQPYLGAADQDLGPGRRESVRKFV